MEQKAETAERPDDDGSFVTGTLREAPPPDVTTMNINVNYGFQQRAKSRMEDDS